MNNKSFEYQNKDIPFLKRDVSFRFLFLGLFAAIFIWQIYSLVSLITNNAEVSIVMIIVSSLVLVFALLFSVISVMYALKSLKIIKVVKENGRCVSSVTLIFSTKKGSFVKLYSLINILLTGISVFILTCSITYSILQLAYFNSISIYMPCLAVLCLCGFNSIYHINTEIKIMNNVEVFNKVY